MKILVIEDEKLLADKSLLTIKDIVEFANILDVGDVKEIFDRQIAYNTAIAKEGLKNNWGANVGSVLLKYNTDLRTKAKAYAAAGSDARMSGCELPVIINSGSGNQGISTTLPMAVFAERMNIPEEKLLRAEFMAMLMIGVGFKLGGEKSQIKTIVKLLAIRYGFATLFSLIFYFVLPFPLEVRQALVILAYSPIGSAVPGFTGEMKGDVGLSSALNSIAMVISITITVILLFVML